MFIHYQSRGGTVTPQDREQLEIDEHGAFTMWRSIVGNAPYPMDAVGRFSGQLDPKTLADLKNEVAAAKGQGDLKKAPPRDAATATIEIDGAQASLGGTDEGEGAWGKLIAHLRTLQFELLRHPQAAIALELTQGGKGARLVHQGKEPLKIDLKDLSVRAVLWEGYTKRGDWRATSKPSASSDSAVPGWSLDLPFGHDFQIGSGQTVKAYVTFAVYDGTARVPVSIVAG